MENLKLRPNHIAISVSRLYESVEWFARVLGFNFIQSVNHPEENYNVAFIRNGRFEIELLEHYAPKRVTPKLKPFINDIRFCGLKHICFEVDDINSLHAHCINERVKVLFGPMTAGNKRTLVIHGPDGIIIEFCQLLSKHKSV